ncbi:MAG: hypothetical protein IJR15_06245, partial [Clostridiales bacterium]|nr:hypothetical protein [Clostridiales bacterium]
MGKNGKGSKIWILVLVLVIIAASLLKTAVDLGADMLIRSRNADMLRTQNSLRSSSSRNDRDDDDDDDD